MTPLELSLALLSLWYQQEITFEILVPYHGRKEELGARIPTISGYKMLDFLAVVLTVGMEETQHVEAKVNVVNVLPSSEL